MSRHMPRHMPMWALACEAGAAFRSRHTHMCAVACDAGATSWHWRRGVWPKFAMSVLIRVLVPVLVLLFSAAEERLVWGRCLTEEEEGLEWEKAAAEDGRFGPL